MTIGERLEEARKRKGISIREAAEATKVRGDYLLAMENNSFEINLPEIYVRGFFKIYVSYLRLDMEKFVADYEALRMTSRKNRHAQNPIRREPVQSPSASTPGVTSSGAQSGRVSFGRMDFGQAEDADLPQAQGPSPLPPGERPRQGEGAQWVRPVIILGAILVVIVVVVVLAVSLFSSRKAAANSEPLAATQSEVRPLTLVASDTVTVWVIRTSDNSRVFEGTLTAGQNQKVNVDGKVEIRYTNGKALLVERDGRRNQMSTTGMGKSVVE